MSTEPHETKVFTLLINRILDLYKENEDLREQVLSQQDMFIRSNNYMNQLQKELEESKNMVQAQNGILEQKVIERTSELQKTNKELQSLLYRASHDLKAPLSTSKGLLNLIKTSSNPIEIKNLTSFIEGTIGKQERLLNNLTYLGILKGKIFNAESFTIKNFIEKAIYEIHSEYKEVNLKSSFHFSEDISIQIDPFIFAGIVNSIIDNSFKYRKGNHVETDITIEKTNHSLIIQFKDHGTGIMKNIKDKVFDMFFRGSEISTGNGLGLFIVKSAVESLHGSVCLQSEENNGTIIILEIPQPL